MSNHVMQSFRTRLTAYFTGPYASDEEAKMEGGNEDFMGNPLHTLEDFLAGDSPYVSVAAGPDVFPYGTRLCIPDLNEHFGQQIEFRAVDHGSAKFFRGREHLDICVNDRQASLNDWLNRKNVLVVVMI